MIEVSPVSSGAASTRSCNRRPAAVAPSSAQNPLDTDGAALLTSCRQVLRCTEWEFVHLELIGDAPQGCLARDRNNPAVRQDCRAVRIGYDRPACEHGLR